MKLWFTDYEGFPEGWNPKIHKYTSLFAHQIYVSRLLYGLVPSGEIGKEDGTGKTVLYITPFGNYVLEIISLDWSVVALFNPRPVWALKGVLSSTSPVMNYRLKLWQADDCGKAILEMRYEGFFKFTFPAQYPREQPNIEVVLQENEFPEDNISRYATPLCVMNNPGDWKANHDVRRAVEVVVLRSAEYIADGKKPPQVISSFIRFTRTRVLDAAI